MAEESRFFNSVEGDERNYQAEDMSQMFANFLGNGFFNGLRVSSTNSMNTEVSEGAAFIEGHAYNNTSTLTVRHDDSDANRTRIDRVVLRLDRTIESRYIRAFVKKGAYSAEPQPPSLERNDYIWEISLAQVEITAGKSYIDSSQITDERGDIDVCGRVQVARDVGDQINTVDIRTPDDRPDRYGEGIMQFYIAGSSQADNFQDWLDSIGISPSDYGRELGSLRAYVHTIANRTNTAVQTFTLFAWDYQSDYEIYGEWKRANNAISDSVEWGSWVENVFVVDSGSTSTGDYVRYSNGVQECWGNPFGLAANASYRNIYMSDSSKWWEYPKPFAGGTTAYASGDISAIGTWASITGSPNGSGVYVRALSYYPHDTEYGCYMYAKGRWR